MNTPNKPSAYGAMMGIRSVWGNNKSFRLLPLDVNCPYLECIYDPESKILVVISKNSKSSYHMLPQLDENGDVVSAKRPRANGKNFREERRTVETYQEYYLIVEEDIYAFLKNVMINYTELETVVKEFIDAPPAAPQTGNMAFSMDPNGQAVS